MKSVTNFGAVHPDEEEPPEASCAGTIMQGKSKPTILTFCQFSRDQIRDHVSTHNYCLEAEDGPITLNPPTNLRATALGPYRIRLTWGDTNGENSYGFVIQRKIPSRRPGDCWFTSSRPASSSSTEVWNRNPPTVTGSMPTTPEKITSSPPHGLALRPSRRQPFRP